VNRLAVAALREALADGTFGGWRRDPATRRTLVKAYEHTSGTERVELEPGEDAKQITVRILIRDQVSGDWTVYGDCKAHSGLRVLLILVAFRLVSPRYSIDYRNGRANGILAVHVAAEEELRRVY